MNDEFPQWLYQEMTHTGVNYADLEIARKYDSRHMKFRDFAKEFELIRNRTGLCETDSVIDLGCGTGAFVLPAARYCKRVYAVDVSRPMLAILQEKIQQESLSNIDIHHAGFLTYRHNAKPADVAVSSIALHHLPDFWKAVSLYRISQMLKPDGILYLNDVIFHFPIENWKNETDQIVRDMSQSAGPEAFTHIQREFSTFDWIIEGILKRTGFQIEQVHDDRSFCHVYICRKVI